MKLTQKNLNKRQSMENIPLESFEKTLKTGKNTLYIRFSFSQLASLGEKFKKLLTKRRL